MHDHYTANMQVAYFSAIDAKEVDVKRGDALLCVLIEHALPLKVGQLVVIERSTPDLCNHVVAKITNTERRTFEVVGSNYSGKADSKIVAVLLATQRPIA